LGASTREAQEEVAYEIAEAVMGAMRGELTSSVVNAPMVAPEVLKELQPYVNLSTALGRAAVQLVADHGFSELEISYTSGRGSDLDTRLLRAMVVKGVLEQITTSQVNIVNADLLAKKRGLKIVEKVIPSDSTEIITNMSVSVKSSDSKFSACIDAGSITVGGVVKQGQAFLTKIGEFDVDISLDISKDVILVKQMDKPGIIAGVSSNLAKYQVNISYMNVAVASNGEAIMAIGVDSLPVDPAEVLSSVASVDGVMETTSFSERI